ncbi:hypothetical protein JCM5350_001196 [Sporobolomyces pararoseus]
MLFSNLLLSTAALVLGATATTVTHVKLETHTLTVHHSSSATPRPFGEHSSKHLRHHHRVESKKNKSTSKKSSKGHKSAKKHHKKSEKTRSSTKHHSTETATRHGGKLASKVVNSHKTHSTKPHSEKPQHSSTKHHSAPTTTSKHKNRTQTKHKPKSTTTKKPHKTSHAVASTAVSKTASQHPVLAVQPSSALSQLAKDTLQAHNDLRAKYKAGPLTWSTDLATAAQQWTDKCIYQHGQGKIIGAGENIAAYTGADNVLGAIKMWSDEASQYNWSSPGYSDGTGHFSQQVWAATTQIGCAQTKCGTLQFPGKPSWSNAYYYVCEYKTSGNVVGQTAEDTAKIFAANVLH